LILLLLTLPISDEPLNLNDGLRLASLDVGVFGKMKPSAVGLMFSLYILAGDGDRQEDEAATPAIDAIPRSGVPAPGGIDGGGIMEAEEAKWPIPPMLIRELLGLSKLGGAGICPLFCSRFVQDASRKFWRSPLGVVLPGLAMLLVGLMGEIMEDMARFKRLPVGVLLKLKARFTFLCMLL